MPGAGVVNENRPHGLPGHAKEMSSALPLDAFLAYHPKVGLVHQRSHLQGMPGMLSAHEPRGLLMQVAVNEREQFIECPPLTLAPGPEEFGHVVGKRRCHGLTPQAHRGGTAFLNADNEPDVA
jgi:hypothetical protein